jgi:5'-methylthioadenosine phosphorylase
MVTDFDCWHPDHDAVDVASVMKTVHDNAEKAARLIARVLRDFPGAHEPCPVGSDRALDGAVMTHPDMRDPALMGRLDAIMARLLRQS